MWETVTSELLLERYYFEKLKELDPFEFLLKIKSAIPLPEWSSFLSGLQRPTTPPPNSSSSPTIFPKNQKQMSSDFPPHTSVPIIMVGIVPPPPPIIPTRYVPLFLPTILHYLPSKYLARIKTFGSEEEITAEEHVYQFNDFIDGEEVDHEDFKMRLFSQIFTGDKCHYLI